MMLLSIIIPVYNEEKLVGSLLRKVVDLHLQDGLSKEIVIVDDGSTDKTFEAVRSFMDENSQSGIRLLRHECNKGKGAAVRTGLAEAYGDVFIIQDADLEYDPEDIREVVRPIMEHRADVVYGSRILMEKALGRSGHQVDEFSNEFKTYRRAHRLQMLSSSCFGTNRHRERRLRVGTGSDGEANQKRIHDS